MGIQIIQPPVVQQDCASCALAPKCWMPGISVRHVVTNLLVCRLKFGLEKDRSAKLLLELLRPKLAKMATEISTAPGVWGADFTTVLSDLETATIEQILTYYTMGEIGYPLHYLFGKPNGVIRRYAQSYVTRIHKRANTELIGSGRDTKKGPLAQVADESQDLDQILDNQSMTALAGLANELIDDGLTLRTSEYRVVRFCLDNMTDEKKPLSGLHLYLSSVMGVVRSRVTRQWSDSCAKLAEKIGRKDWDEIKNS